MLFRKQNCWFLASYLQAWLELGKAFLGKWNFPSLWCLISYLIAGFHFVYLYARLLLAKIHLFLCRAALQALLLPLAELTALDLNVKKSMEKTIHLVLLNNRTARVVTGKRTDKRNSQGQSCCSPMNNLCCHMELSCFKPSVNTWCKPNNATMLFWDLDLSPFHSSPCSFSFAHHYKTPVKTRSVAWSQDKAVLPHVVSFWG